MEKTLYIRNFGNLMSADKLEEMFSSVGEVIAAKIEFKNIRDKIYRVAYVTMETNQQATEGIDRFHGHKLDGDSLIVTLDVPHVPGPIKIKSQSKSLSK